MDGGQLCARVYESNLLESEEEDDFHLCTSASMIHQFELVTDQSGEKPYLCHDVGYFLADSFCA